MEARDDQAACLQRPARRRMRVIYFVLIVGSVLVLLMRGSPSQDEPDAARGLDPWLLVAAAAYCVGVALLLTDGILALRMCGRRSQNREE